VSGVAALSACLGALALIGCEPGAGVDGSQQMPADVLAFRARRDECDHFRAEEATDQARAAFLEKTLARTCTGTDAALASLKRRYARRPAIMAALSHYDERIE
jgi:hypothetical protein